MKIKGVDSLGEISGYKAGGWGEGVIFILVLS